MTDTRRRRLKVAFISQYFFPEQFLNNSVAARLVKEGHSVQVFSCVPNYGKTSFYEGYSNHARRSEEWNGVQIDRAFTVARGSSAARLALNYATYPFAGLWTYYRRKLWKPDVTFVSMPSPVFQAILAMLIKKIWGVPTVHWIQDLWPDTAEVVLSIKSPVTKWLLSAISKTLYRSADIVLIQSEMFRHKLVAMGVDNNVIRYFPNTAPDHFQPIAPSEATEFAKSFHPKRFNLVFAGNVGESQDFHTVLAAVDLVRKKIDIQFIVIGSGRGLDAAQAEVSRLDLADHVSFLGRHEELLMPKFFAHADALLVSLKDNPIFAMTVPFKVQCYLACGKPIVASLSGEGARILQTSGAAMVASSGNPEKLAEVISNMMDLSAMDRKKMGAFGRIYFEEHFHPERVYSILTDALYHASKMGPS